MNKEELKKYRREFYKIWRKNNPEKVKEVKKRYRKKHLSGRAEYNKQWKRKNPETNVKSSLNRKISKSIRKSLKGNKAGRHWEDLVGYTLKDLYKRLKKTIPIGYTWDDYMNAKLHIDHIVPIDAFNFAMLEHIDFRKCWALKNLRLLPAKDNLIKGNKLDKPFQPSLRV